MIDEKYPCSIKNRDIKIEALILIFHNQSSYISVYDFRYVITFKLYDVLPLSVL